MLWRKPKRGGDIDRRKPADRPVFDRTLMRGNGKEIFVRGLVKRRWGQRLGERQASALCLTSIGRGA